MRIAHNTLLHKGKSYAYFCNIPHHDVVDGLGNFGDFGCMGSWGSKGMFPDELAGRVSARLELLHKAIAGYFHSLARHLLTQVQWMFGACVRVRVLVAPRRRARYYIITAARWNCAESPDTAISSPPRS